MRGRRWRSLLLLSCLTGACAPKDSPIFRVDNARAHVDRLAGTIGSRPLGSQGNAAARAYLIDQLRLYGFEVRLQDVDASRPDAALTARVSNIVAIKRGERAEAVALVAHVDSVPEGPGAMDDGLGVAVVLEAGRVLAARRQSRYSLVVLITDGEEAGLMGGAAAADDAELRARVRAYLNFEAIGGSGPSILFESGPGNEVVIRAWARSAPNPRGASFAAEIYQRLPNDTDFSMLKRWGVPGLNFAPIGDSHAYHTSRDVPDRVRSETLRQTGETAVAVVQGLDAIELEPAGGARRDVRFSDLLGRHVIVLTHVQGRAIAIVAICAGLWAWTRVVRRVWQAGALPAISTLFWGLLSLAAGGGLMLGAVWLLRATREVYHPWYAHPGRLLALLVICGIVAPWYTTRLAWLLPERLRYLRTPDAVWALALIPWCALAGVIEWTAPAAAHLWSIPLLVAGLLVAVAPASRPLWGRLASLVTLMVCAAVFIPDGVLLFHFLVAIFGRLPMVTPSWVYPAFVALIGLMVAPPAVAMLVGLVRGRRSQGLIGGLLLASLAATTLLAGLADAYTPSNPMRRYARYVSDQVANVTFWEVSGNEPGLDLDLPAADAARWRPVAQGTPWPGSLPALSTRAGAFMFRREAAPMPPPAAVSARTTRVPGGSGVGEPAGAGTTEYEVAVVPSEAGVTASLVLPAGVTPTRATPAGAAWGARWHSTVLAVPATGVSFRIAVPDRLAAQLAATTVVLGTWRSPAAEGGGPPRWLPRGHADWNERAAWVVAPVPAAEVPATPPPPAAAQDLPIVTALR